MIASFQAVAGQSPGISAYGGYPLPILNVAGTLYGITGSDATHTGLRLESSADGGITWPDFSTDAATSAASFVYGNGVFALTPGANTISTWYVRSSTDGGHTFGNSTLPAQGYLWANNLTFSRSQFIMGTVGGIYSSPNAASPWTLRSNAMTGVGFAVDGAGGVVGIQPGNMAFAFVVSGDDGVTWTKLPVHNQTYIPNVALYGGGLWAAFPASDGASPYWYSTDKANWNSASLPSVLSSNPMGAPIYGDATPDGIFAISGKPSLDTIFVTTDCVNWTAIKTPVTAVQSWEIHAIGPGKFLVRDIATQSAYVLTLTPGTQAFWTNFKGEYESA